MAAGRIMPYPYPYPYPYPTNAVCACECVPLDVCLCENVSVYVCASVRAGVCVRVAVRGSQIGKTMTDRSQDQGCTAFDRFGAFNSFDVQTFSVHCIRRVLRILCATTQKKSRT